MRTVAGGLYVPVIAGLAIGILLVTILAFTFKPAFAKTDEELIAETKELKEVRFLLSRYNDVKPIIDRETERGEVVVSYQVERQICEPTNRFGDDCTRILALNVILPSIGPSYVYVSCLGPISVDVEGDLIGYIESPACLGFYVTVTDDNMMAG